MCYAIPGRVIELDGRCAIIDYFGERKKAYTDLAKPAPGDYVYAQGGFVIQTVPEPEAATILADWQELFFRLKQTDRQLVSNPRTLYERANQVRQQAQGNACCVHGILEFSNYCRNNCLYCGIRQDNRSLTRFRMTPDEILEAAEYAVKQLGFRALVLQSGEDPWYDEAKLSWIVSEIRSRLGALIFVSLGERPFSSYRRLFASGARGALIRFETADTQLYRKIKPESNLADRLKLIKALRELGYLIITGFLVGLPESNTKDILKNIKLTAQLSGELISPEADLGADLSLRSSPRLTKGEVPTLRACPSSAREVGTKEGMFSFGPFLPHPQTPLARSKAPPLSTILRTIAQTRLMYPQAKILVTTALETLAPEQGARQALMAGANSLMINITPLKYRRLYEIYPHRAGVEDDTPKRINQVIQLLRSLGRAPTDLGV